MIKCIVKAKIADSLFCYNFAINTYTILRTQSKNYNFKNSILKSLNVAILFIYFLFNYDTFIVSLYKFVNNDTVYFASRLTLWFR